MKHTLRVRLQDPPDRSYTIIVQPGIFDSIPRRILREHGRRPIFLITDSTVARLYGRQMLRTFVTEDANGVMIDVPPGEPSKSAAMVYALHTQLLVHGISRDSLIVALGGGVVGDLAGFVAATVLRGVPCIQVPTTLLAQVDSSVGGKVGIDHPLGKNLIGAFHQPAAVFVDPGLLRTLPVREYRNGLAEMVKIAAALDRRLFADLERHARRLRKTNVGVLSGLVTRCIGLKAAVVRQDEFEGGLRKTLNLGHTIGHAVEAASGFSVKHGAAVAMGLVAEARIARTMGLLADRDYRRLVRAIAALGLPVRIPRLREPGKFFPALDADKKGSGAGAKFVLLKAIGHSVVGISVPKPFIREVVPLP